MYKIIITQSIFHHTEICIINLSFFSSVKNMLTLVLARSFLIKVNELLFY
jgi:hypothetical protein